MATTLAAFPNIPPDLQEIIAVIIADMLDGDIDHEETKTKLRDLGKLGVALARAALRAKGVFWDMIAGPFVEKAIMDAVEKFIADHAPKV